MDEKEVLANLIDMANKGYRVKHYILYALRDEISTMYKSGYPIPFLKAYLEKEYGFAVTERYIYKFIKNEFKKPKRSRNRKNSPKLTDFQRLPSQNEYNSTVSEEEAVSDASPYEEGSYSHKRQSAKDEVENARTTIIEAETLETTPSEPPASDTKQNGEYEIAPIGIERKYSLEEIFPREKWRFDVYNLPLKEGLEKEIEDMYIIDAFECAMEIRRINYPKEYENEKTDFLKRLLWRVMKRGYKYNPFHMEYDKEAKNIYLALGYETSRLYEEDVKNKRIGRLTKPEFNSYDTLAIKNKYKERWLERMRSIANKNTNKEKQ